LSRCYLHRFQLADHEDLPHDKAEFFERFTENLPIGIQIKSLSKTFGTNRAVKKLNLDMYEGHITVLLGHNGAGKTTTMLMITGMFPPSMGTAVVNGYDIRTSIQNVRDSMGLCLQHNVLFDRLTVAEHLYFFGKLKGLNNEEVKGQIDNYIKLLELEDKVPSITQKAIYILSITIVEKRQIQHFVRRHEKEIECRNGTLRKIQNCDA
jgi:ATP-binding cassette subfamily A (ABC1) protein 3